MPNNDAYARKIESQYSKSTLGLITKRYATSETLFSINRLSGITDEDINRASKMQRYRNSGFWEMQRVIGQFGAVAEEIIQDGVDQIITAAVSGGVIGEHQRYYEKSSKVA